MANGTLAISGVQTGVPQGSVNFNLTIPFSSLSDGISLILASGANTISVPAGCQGCVIIPPSGNVIALTLKGITGDTGVGLFPSLPSVIALASSVSSFVITAASATSGNTLVQFF